MKIFVDKPVEGCHQRTPWIGTACKLREIYIHYYR